ncbi:MAG TPA: PEGA domain-containing protein [Polyangiaceae bacterium]
MMRASLRGGLGVALLAALALGTAARTARAEPPNAKATPVYVLSLWTDDSDDQADALTQALRSRVRQAQGWSLLETPQSFETLSIALKCPAKPDPPCLQRIADQLHADHYMWGTMARKKGAGEVSADLHLWSRGKGDNEATEVYSDNLKDASDESLRQIAAQVFAKVTGGSVAGTLVVHAGSGGGTVLVDGTEKATLTNGVARVDLPGGSHTVTVRVQGFDASTQQASVPAGQEQEMTFSLTQASAAPEPAAHGTFPTRKVVAYGAIVVGAGLLVGSGVETAAWINDSNTSKSDRANVNPSINDVCASEINASAVDACKRSKDAVTVSTLGWVFGGAGLALVGTGIVLLVTGHGSGDSGHDAGTTARSNKPQVDVLPMVGTRSGVVDLRVTF